MALIKCGGCESIYESNLTVCPVCARCPGCGTKRAPHINKVGDCPKCQAPYCSGCGRCHVCGSTRPTDLPPCSCGHPKDLEKLARTEEAWALTKRRGGGCAPALALWVGLSSLGAWLSHSLWKCLDR
jgi:hypothetical protein